MMVCPDNTFITRNSEVSEINKRSENDQFKVLCVIFEEMSGNIQNIGGKQLKQIKFGHFFTQTLTRGAFFYQRKPPKPQNR